MNFMKKIFCILLLFLVFSFLGCTQKSEEEKAKLACIEECKKALNEGKDLSFGPCLLNPIKELPDWVCDVAHSPREAVDNLEENQCSAYRQGKAKHFVEVDPSCNFIRAW